MVARIFWCSFRMVFLVERSFISLSLLSGSQIEEFTYATFVIQALLHPIH